MRLDAQPSQRTQGRFGAPVVFKNTIIGLLAQRAPALPCRELSPSRREPLTTLYASPPPYTLPDPMLGNG